VLMTAPLAPHIAEELWSRLGHPHSLAYAPFPVADPALTAEDTVELPVQFNGRVRFTVAAPVDADQDAVRALVTGSPEFGRWVDGQTVRRVVVVPGRIVNVVTGS
jgi:leucyl-tRNA synthetase